VAHSRSEGSIARFERVAVVLSGSGALGAYQAGALTAMELADHRPNWLAGIGTGAFNAAIAAGNPPGERGAKLLFFWRALGEIARQDAPTLRERLRRRLGAGHSVGTALRAEPGQAPRRPIDTAKLRALLAQCVDFARINSGLTRLTLGTTHLATGAELSFDNDRHIIGIDHVMASASLPGGMPPVMVDGEPYGTGAVLAVNSLSGIFDAAAPADTLCFVIDGFDPAPPGSPGCSRSGQQIAAYRRAHDLRRIVGFLGERLPPELRRDSDVRRCLAQGSMATMNLVHLVHEGGGPTELAGKLADFSGGGLAERWRAGERDMAASLARSAWLAPPSRRVGVVVHELRGSAPRSRIR